MKMNVLLMAVGKLFTIAAGMYYFRKLPLAYRILLLQIVTGLLAEAYGYYISRYLHKYNTWLFNLNTFFEFLLLSGTAALLVGEKNIRMVIYLLVAVVTVIWVRHVTRDLYGTFVSDSMVTGCVALVFQYGYLLYNNVLFEKGNLFRLPLFWLCIGNLLYFGGDIPLMGLYNSVNFRATPVASTLSRINEILDIIRYPLYGIGFLMFRYLAVNK